MCLAKSAKCLGASLDSCRQVSCKFSACLNVTWGKVCSSVFDSLDGMNIWSLHFTLVLYKGLALQNQRKTTKSANSGVSISSEIDYHNSAAHSIMARDRGTLAGCVLPPVLLRQWSSSITFNVKLKQVPLSYKTEQCTLKGHESVHSFTQTILRPDWNHVAEDT